MIPRKGSASEKGHRPATAEDERRSFEQEMQGVKPLAPGPRCAVPDWDTKPEPAARKPSAQAVKLGLHTEVNGEKVSGAAFGVAHDLLHDLAAGRIPPEAELNLHHAPADSAVHRTQRFVELSMAQGRRCVLIIHGRGQHSGPSGPALLPALLEALEKRPLNGQVLAATTAPPQYGGSGALLLLLRKSANQK